VTDRARPRSGPAALVSAKVRTRLGPAARRLEHLTPIRVAAATVRVFSRSQGGPRAAEIAYYAILSIIPFAALLLTAFGYVAGYLQSIGWTVERMASTMQAIVASFLPLTAPDLEAGLRDLLQGRGALGIFGGVAILMTSSMVFGAISRALTAIFGVRSRGRILSTVLFSVVLCAISILVIMGLHGLASWTAIRESMGLEPGTLSPAWIQALGGLVLGLTFIFLVYGVVRVRISLPHTIAGAATFVAIFGLSRWGFVVYLETISQLHTIYGSVVGVMTAILWADIVSAALLLSMSLVHVLDDRLHAGPMGDLPGHAIALTLPE
jgi:membrane protein